MSRDKIIVILGPTASGKSELAVKLARKFKGEIISADSRQVYKNLDIGSGKITPDTKNSSNFSTGQAKKKYIFTYKGIPHYCIDIANPKKVFTVQDFKKFAQKAMSDIAAHKKIPIVCGGTGFYIDALFGGIKIPQVPPDWKLRKKLEKKSTEALFKILKKLDPSRAKNIDPKNRRRLIRAIEIVKITKKPVPPSSFRTPAKNVLFLGLTHPPAILKKRIEKRIKEMLKKGLIKEVRKLRRLGLTWKRIQELGFEYKEPALYLQNKIPSRQKRDPLRKRSEASEARPDKHRGGSKEQMLASLKTENWHYAKRQLTWFKRNKHICWIKSRGEAEKLVKKFLK